jgi:hypothetical protein
MGMLAMSLAAITNGFAVPLFAIAYPRPLTPESAAGVQAILYFAASLNRSLANLAVVATSLSVGLLSCALWNRVGPSRAIAALGLLISSGSALGLISGWFQLDYTGFNLTNGLLYLWVGALGLFTAISARQTHLAPA